MSSAAFGTKFSLDTEFVFTSHAVWGIKSWAQGQVRRLVIYPTKTPRSVLFLKTDVPTTCSTVKTDEMGLWNLYQKDNAIFEDRYYL